MPIDLYQPAEGTTVSNPVVLEWEQNGTQDNVWYNVGNDGWQQFTSSEYSCSTTCTATIDVGSDITTTVEVWMNGEYSQEVSFSTTMLGGGDPDQIIGQVTIAEGSTVTLAEGSEVSLGTGMTVEQMTEIGGSIVLALTVAGAYRLVKQFMLNR